MHTLTRSAATDDTQAAVEHVLGIIGGHQVFQATYVVAWLGVADLIAAGVDHTDELAPRAGAVPDRLRRPLRTLAGQGMLVHVGDDRWGLTSAGALLRSDVPVRFTS